MKPIPANEVIDASAGTGGLVHVSTFLAKAFAQLATEQAKAAASADQAQTDADGADQNT